RLQERVGDERFVFGCARAEAFEAQAVFGHRDVPDLPRDVRHPARRGEPVGRRNVEPLQQVAAGEVDLFEGFTQARHGRKSQIPSNKSQTRQRKRRRASETVPSCWGSSLGFVTWVLRFPREAGQGRCSSGTYFTPVLPIE